jgi:hypothetical protein
LTVRVKIIGRDRLNGKLGRIAIEGVRGVERAIALSGLEVQTEARRLIQQGPPRTGVTETIGGKQHTRSAPGEPPKTDTGRLVSNISAILDGDQLGVEVGTRLDYGIHLMVFILSSAHVTEALLPVRGYCRPMSA